MKKIICRRCGTEIDAALGECPVCGAVYYILADENAAAPLWTVDEILSEAEAAPGTESTFVPTQGAQTPVFSTQRPTQRPQTPVQGTQSPTQSVQKPAYNTQRPTQGVQMPVTNAQRPTQSANRPAQSAQRPTGEAQRRRAAMEQDEAYIQTERRGLDNRTRGFIVGAVALLAVLTVIICAMSGAFDFDKNSETQYMPNLIGLTAEGAETILESLDLKLDVSLIYESSAQPEGTVIGQSAKEGKKLSKKDSIVLTISKGDLAEAPDSTETPAAKVQVPDLAGKTYDEARDILMALGLTISKTDGVYSDSVELDRIVTQSPERGAELAEGGMVIVTLSNGPTPTEAPKVHIITVTAGKGGSISPKGQVEVTDGESIAFTITPDEGYEIREVKVDGTDVGPAQSYTFTNVTSDHTIYAVFQPIPEESDEPTETPTETPTEAPTETPTDTPTETPVPPTETANAQETPADTPAEPTQPVTAPEE